MAEIDKRKEPEIPAGRNYGPKMLSENKAAIKQFQERDSFLQR